MWYSWRCCLEKGKDPNGIIGPLIHWSILHVRYDRKVAGRAPIYDVYDYRAGLKRQQLSGQGQASPTDRGDRGNDWINWAVKAGADDPAELAAALEAAGLTLADWTD
jgi:hypothetical protein